MSNLSVVLSRQQNWFSQIFGLRICPRDKIEKPKTIFEPSLTSESVAVPHDPYSREKELDARSAL